jgi:hypothetical protein
MKEGRKEEPFHGRPVRIARHNERFPASPHPEICLGTKYAVSRNIPVQNIQSVEIFQCKIYSQHEYSSAKYAVSKDIPVQNMQSVRIFQYKIFSQQTYSSTKYSVSRNIPVQNMQSAEIFQCKICSQQKCSSAKYSVSKDIPVQNKIFKSVGHTLFSQ